MLEPNFYQEFIRPRVCLPQIAASLILGLEPRKTVSMNPYAPRLITILDGSINALLDKLTNDDPMYLYDRDIFFYVNLALNIGVDVHSNCIASIALYFLKLPKKSKLPFREAYPYLYRVVSIHKKTSLLSMEEKYSKWREIAKTLCKKQKFHNKDQLARAVWEYLKNTDPRYIEKKSKGYYGVNTIKRNISTYL